MDMLNALPDVYVAGERKTFDHLYNYYLYVSIGMDPI